MADANRTTQTGPTESENRDRNAFQDDNTADTAGGAALEIDNDFLEQDSAYGTSSDNGSNFTSLNSSVTDYVRLTTKDDTHQFRTAHSRFELRRSSRTAVDTTDIRKANTSPQMTSKVNSRHRKHLKRRKEAQTHPFPEMDREDMKHHWCKLVLSGKLHLAPLTNPTRILDIGVSTKLPATKSSTTN